jgi:hypothetical protein
MDRVKRAPCSYYTADNHSGVTDKSTAACMLQLAKLHVDDRVHVRPQIGVPLIEIRNMCASFYPCSPNATIVETLGACARQAATFPDYQKKKLCGDALIVENKRLDLQGRTGASSSTQKVSSSLSPPPSVVQ